MDDSEENLELDTHLDDVPELTRPETLESSSNSENYLFPSTTHNTSLIIRENVDDLLAHKDNLVMLFSVPCARPFNKSAQLLANLNKLPPLSDLMLDRGQMFPSENNGKHLIILSIKERHSTLLDLDILIELFRSLLNITLELNLNTFCITKTVSLDVIN